MAYKDSDELKTNERYPLGDYSFHIERSSVPGSTNDKIEAICTDKDGHNARKSIQIPSSTQLDGWYVEANETEATIYAVINVPKGGSEKESDLNTGIPQPVLLGGHVEKTDMGGERTLAEDYYNNCAVCSYDQGTYLYIIIADSSPFTDIPYGIRRNSYTHSEAVLLATSYAEFTHNGKKVYYYAVSGSGYGAYSKTGINVGNPNVENVAWTIIYGNDSGGTQYEVKEIMVARFAIDVEGAGGVGPGSDWIDPGDYDPDWEEGDPTHTLYVTVTGALSGRHNDPIEDPSYSYIPADKDTVKDYGCGGDGGHGGGGGAGASTVVIYKFATNQANSKEVTAIARRHGYGSGGGKGGKGGDGCILVYY